MDARIAAWVLLICLGLGAAVGAATIDDRLAAGRARLFHGTPPALSAACDLFEAGLREAQLRDSSPCRELLFLHALARTAMLLGDPAERIVPDGLLRWFEPYAAALATGNIDDLPISPSAQANRMDDITAELASIQDNPTPFVLRLVPAETGLRDMLEIDYSDVLMLRSVLLACRASVIQQRAHVLDNADIGCAFDPRVLRAIDAWLCDAPCLVGFSAPPGLEDVAQRDAVGVQARRVWADAVACYLKAVSHILAEDEPPGTDSQSDELIYLDLSARAHVDRCTVALAALRDTPGVSTPQARTGIWDVFDANSVWLGELVLVFDRTNAGGTQGRLTLADGSALEIDWFGILDAGEIGISMFAPDQATQGWIQGAITTDHATITDAVMDLWGAERQVLAGISARLTGTDRRQGVPEPRPLIGAAPPQPSLDVPVRLDELIARAGDQADWGI
ncbi:MAG: hypothetical protein JW993_15150 [Sedimentisphaerales bacterium]|nr:hypothetical protein [Sedimentisphaerales bacterium]